jgi:hypothetical protein
MLISKMSDLYLHITQEVEVPIFYKKMKPREFIQKHQLRSRGWWSGSSGRVPASQA